MFPLHKALLALAAAAFISPAGARPSDLDPTFGGNGVQHYSLGFASFFPSSLMTQPDGMLVSGGRLFGDLRALVRVDGTGQKDPGFGTNGVATAAIGSRPSERVSALARLPDGRIVAAAQSRDGWKAKRAVDLDGDGRADIIWEHPDGRVAVWLMNGTAMVSGAEILGPGTGWSVSSATQH